MVAAGMTPKQALVAATKTAAEMLKLDQLGTVAAGKSADFIVLTRIRWTTSITRGRSRMSMNAAISLTARRCGEVHERAVATRPARASKGI